jgi:GT2 family glycosyltransferase
MPKCSIIIPVFNKASLTRQCLNTLLALSPETVDFEIIVVNDASTDATGQVLNGFGDQIRVITHTANMGFATACNEGAEHASGTYLVFLNNDTIVTAGWLDSLAHYADSHPDAAVVGSKLLYPNDTIQHAGVAICQDGDPRHLYAGFAADHPAVNKSRRFQVVTAACALFRREPFEQIGGFDTAFRNGFEDVDICLRLGEVGHEVHYCHESVLYHLESVSVEGLSKERKQNYRLYRDRWAHRVQPDDLQYYVEDNLLTISYSQYYPLRLEISPLLAVLDTDEHEHMSDRLLHARSRQVFDLLKETIRLSVRVHEAELQAGSISITGVAQTRDDWPHTLEAER